MDRLLIQRRASQIREKLGVDLNSPIDLFSLVSADTDLTLVVYPFKKEISGICIKTAKLIAINSNSTHGRKMFSLAHELYHYYFDEEQTTVSYFFEDKNTAKIEKEANLFASYLLMPDSSFSNLCDKLTQNRKDKIDVIKIMEIEQYFRTSRKAVLTRLMIDNIITSEEESQFSTDIIKTAKRYGYDISLYLPSDSNIPKTYGAYLKKALKLKNEGIISDGKYEEYLFDANRSDIVFDDNGEDEIYD